MAKRILLVLLASTALAGCARLADRSYGSWLDSFGIAPRTVPEADPQAQAKLQQLDAQAEAIRVKLASETDRVKRIGYLRDLRDIGDEQRAIARDLRYGRVPMTFPYGWPDRRG
jgi:hypothetical protein